LAFEKREAIPAIRGPLDTEYALHSFRVVDVTTPASVAREDADRPGNCKAEQMTCHVMLPALRDWKPHGTRLTYEWRWTDFCERCGEWVSKFLQSLQTFPEVKKQTLAFLDGDNGQFLQLTAVFFHVLYQFADSFT